MNRPHPHPDPARRPGVVPFHLLVLGPFPRARVHTTLEDTRMATNAETLGSIAAAWDERTARAAARGQWLFPGAMCRLRTWRIEHGALHVAFGRTDYRELVGTNLAHPEIGERFGDDFLSNGAGVCAVVTTSDGKLVIQRRGERVFEHPGFLHVCGGALDPRDDAGSAGADPFAVMTRELDEELNVPAGAIAGMVCLGLARDGLTHKPEVLMRTRLALASTELPTVEGGEHTGLVLVDDTPAALGAWMTSHWPEIAPAGLACLTAHLATWGMGDE